MTAWVGDIEQATLGNRTFRTVLFTGSHLQLTVMRLAAGEEIGRERHAHLDQFIRVEAGRARLELGASADVVDETYDLGEDWAVIVPAGTWHNVLNDGVDEVKLYSLYAPPEHASGTIHRAKADADAAEDAHPH